MDIPSPPADNEAVAEAFARKASLYDAFGQNHPALERMRAQVRQHVLAHLQPGDRLLELNAGTGLDAAFFAGRGFAVHATDLSPGMVAQIAAKATRPELAGRLTVQQLSFTRLDQAAGGPYDTVFSNMGGVNCTADLPAITRRLPAVLKPGGFVTWVVMPRLCLWELAAALRGDFRTARRRMQPGGVLANVEGVQFRTTYYWPEEVRAAFGPDFTPVALRGLGVFTPPADHKGFARRFPGLFRLLCALDDRLAGRAPFNRWGDFFILTLCYLPSGTGPA